MNTVERHLRPKATTFAVRPIAERDIAQCVEIERDAFPTSFPPTPFRREINSPVASYLVTWQQMKDAILGGLHATSESGPLENEDPTITRKLFSGIRNLCSVQYSAEKSSQDFIAGFLGIWYIADEAHIVSVGVRSSHRGQGIGELLLIGAIEQALLRQARAITLEVRASNYIAKSLYSKYGFAERGKHKAYYADDHEDAIIMTTGPIDTHSYPHGFRELVEAHMRSWGYRERVVA